MADFTNEKKDITASYPVNAVEDSYAHLEPLITVEKLKTRHLIGIPLVSATKDPLTGERTRVTDEMLSELIHGAVAVAEQELKIDIFPVVRSEKHPFDRNLYTSFMYVQLKHKPATSILKFSVTPASELDVYVVPPDWIETNLAAKGQINVVPLNPAFVQGTYIASDNSQGGAAFMTVMSMLTWTPAFWQIQYCSGFKDGMVPRLINEYIGLTAAAELLSQLATTYARVTSFSQGIDAMSQSAATPGPNIFKVRTDEIQQKLASIRGKVRNVFGHGVFASTL